MSNESLLEPGVRAYYPEWAEAEQRLNPQIIAEKQQNYEVGRDLVLGPENTHSSVSLEHMIIAADVAYIYEAVNKGGISPLFFSEIVEDLRNTCLDSDVSYPQDLKCAIEQLGDILELARNRAVSGLQEAAVKDTPTYPTELQLVAA